MTSRKNDLHRRLQLDRHDSFRRGEFLSVVFIVIDYLLSNYILISGLILRFSSV